MGSRSFWIYNRKLIEMGGGVAVQERDAFFSLHRERIYN